MAQVEAGAGLHLYNTAFIDYLSSYRETIADRVTAYRTGVAPLLDFILMLAED